MAEPSVVTSPSALSNPSRPPNLSPSRYAIPPGALLEELKGIEGVGVLRQDHYAHIGIPGPNVA